MLYLEEGKEGGVVLLKSCHCGKNDMYQNYPTILCTCYLEKGLSNDIQ